MVQVSNRSLAPRAPALARSRRARRTLIHVARFLPTHTYVDSRRRFAKVHTDSHTFATDSRMDSRAFATHSRADSPGFPQIPQDSPGFPKDLRGFADLPKIPRIRADIRRFAKVRNGYTPIRGWIYTHSRKFADGYTPIRTRSTAISHHSSARGPCLSRESFKCA